MPKQKEGIVDTKRKTLNCICPKQGCWRGEDSGVPLYCEANAYPEVITESTGQYNSPEAKRIYRAAAAVGQDNNGMNPRITEAVLLAKEMGVKKVGFAACTAMVWELSQLVKLFKKEGFEVVTAGCQIGRVSPEHRGAPELKGCVRAWCNPIAQAGILNVEKTGLNFIVGLCMGHDILFVQHSKAPASTLIVKDRVTGNNPAAALYGWHRRKLLFGVEPTADEEV
jgi:uncharacterized metal-binding protein